MIKELVDTWKDKLNFNVFYKTEEYPNSIFELERAFVQDGNIHVNIVPSWVSLDGDFPARLRVIMQVEEFLKTFTALTEEESQEAADKMFEEHYFGNLKSIDEE